MERLVRATGILHPELSLHYRSDWCQPDEYALCATEPVEFELLFKNLRLTGRLDAEGRAYDARLETEDHQE